jgi:hypothetical protein
MKLGHKWSILAAIVAMFAQYSGQVSARTQPTPELQQLDDALPGNLINDPTRLDWNAFGPGVSYKPVKGKDIPGGGALQFTIPKAGATLYEIGANAPLAAPIKKGQQILVAFYARTLSSSASDGKGRIGVRFQQNAAPYAGFGDSSIVIEKEWKLYEVTGVANTDIDANLAVVGFQLAGAKQVIEIAQTYVIEGMKTIASPAGGIAEPVMIPQLEGKGTLINDPTNLKWQVFGAGETHKTVPAKGFPGGQATQFVIAQKGKFPYDIGTNAPITEDIKQGDIMIVAFLARTIVADTPDGLGVIGVRVQQNLPPDYPGFGDKVLQIGPNWRLYQIKTQAKQDIPKGQGVIGLHLAGAKQTIEIGRAYVLKDVAP